ncbi:hypothetical protein [Methylomonas methanica]|uniref:Uncharacterized protein n=1 Tax=Methylomonas methanica TaxID=421 RepID=A0A177MQF6_METMH|nr:hypothetical protein [Methylomonas methanica]OAI07822.1 hypothetical protein A1332_00040 [Methylomonas methanica]
MKYHPGAIMIALISATLSSYFVAAILFPDTGAKIVGGFQGEGAVVMWIALVAVMLAVAFYVKTNKTLIDRVLTGRASTKEISDSFLTIGFFKKKD